MQTSNTISKSHHIKWEAEHICFERIPRSRQTVGCEAQNQICVYLLSRILVNFLRHFRQERDQKYHISSERGDWVRNA